MYIALGILALVAIYLISFYNSLKTALVQIGASIQEIGNQLKRQADLIPNLIESVKGFMKQEKGIFDELTSARKQIETAVKSNSGKEIDKAQDLIGKVMGSINVIMESNPEIKSSTLVSDLMNELRDTSDKIMYARRTLIDLSADYNIKISTIPGMWLAPTFGFKPEKGLDTPTTGAHLTVSATDTVNPTVKLN
jgi:LemA protein